MSTKIGSVAVDSGQIMIIDPCYINADFVKEFNAGPLDKFNNTPTQDSYEMNYDGCCNATLSKRGYGSLEKLAIACGTLYGDGEFPVYAEFNSSGQVTSLTIDFDPTPESETCYTCGEDLYHGYCDCEDENDDEHWED